LWRPSAGHPAAAPAPTGRRPEWLAAADAAGWKPSPDVLVAMLRRHRRSPNVAALVIAFGRPVAPWLLEQLPEMQPFETRPGAPAQDPRVLPVPAELEPLLDGPGATLAEALVGGLTAGAFKWAHRTLLLNTVARVPRRSLDAVGAALEAGRASVEQGRDALGERAAPLALWESLLELADIRRAMLDELEPQ